mmetsp:Transcript_105935/g.299678  ORF Transcript_105935/g.299678 Transcript_105935/m.299678 type:complete len:217 (+) Transcript_105935:89-739(+)
MPEAPGAVRNGAPVDKFQQGVARAIHAGAVRVGEVVVCAGVPPRCPATHAGAGQEAPEGRAAGHAVGDRGVVRAAHPEGGRGRVQGREGEAPRVRGGLVLPRVVPGPAAEGPAAEEELRGRGRRREAAPAEAEQRLHLPLRPEEARHLHAAGLPAGPAPGQQAAALHSQPGAPADLGLLRARLPQAGGPGRDREPGEEHGALEVVRGPPAAHQPRP